MKYVLAVFGPVILFIAAIISLTYINAGIERNEEKLLLGTIDFESAQDIIMNYRTGEEMDTLRIVGRKELAKAIVDEMENRGIFIFEAR